MASPADFAQASRLRQRHVDPHERRPRLPRRARGALGLVPAHQRDGPRARALAVQGRVPFGGGIARRARSRRCCRRCRPDRSGSATASAPPTPRSSGARAGPTACSCGPTCRSRRSTARAFDAPVWTGELLVGGAHTDHPAGRWGYVVTLNVGIDPQPNTTRVALGRPRRRLPGERGDRGVRLADRHASRCGRRPADTTSRSTRRSGTTACSRPCSPTVSR